MTQIINQTGFARDTFSAVPVALADYTGGPAVALAVEDDLSAVAAHFGTLELIVVPFASSADGRGFSMAGELRALGYMGHLRAQGHVLVDQFRAALRCGFDDVEISDEQAQRNPEPQWMAVPMGDGYQPRVFA